MELTLESSLSVGSIVRYGSGKRIVGKINAIRIQKIQLNHEVYQIEYQVDSSNWFAKEALVVVTLESLEMESKDLIMRTDEIETAKVLLES